MFAARQAVLLLLSRQSQLHSLQLGVQQECSEPAAHVVVGQEPDIELRELECHGELVVKLVDNVKELEEDWSEAAVLARVVKVAPVVEPDW